MAITKKKTWPEFFEAILSGKKKFDLRLADFPVFEGDVIVFEEYNPETRRYTGRKIEKKIGFLLKTRELEFWTKEEIDKYGLVVMSLE
ncbi:MAG: DUF3850 domain-containing protein [Nanoarchaeota archaeon]|nr:DUF3850 domain-containing protein [Nanoarchaeota archaeon]